MREAEAAAIDGRRAFVSQFTDVLIAARSITTSTSEPEANRTAAEVLVGPIAAAKSHDDGRAELIDLWARGLLALRDPRITDGARGRLFRAIDKINRRWTRGQLDVASHGTIENLIVGATLGEKDDD